MKLGAWTIIRTRDLEPVSLPTPPQFSFLPDHSPLTDLFGLMYALSQIQMRTAPIPLPGENNK
jgi:hypothetical protein